MVALRYLAKGVLGQQVSAAGSYSTELYCAKPEAPSEIVSRALQRTLQRCCHCNLSRDHDSAPSPRFG
jgi:hypothetical protein